MIKHDVCNYLRPSHSSASSAFYVLLLSYVAAGILSLAALPAGAYELPSATGTHRVAFSSEEGDFNEYTRVINLKGSVQLDELDQENKVIKIIKGRNLSIDVASRTIHVPEDFVMDSDSGTVYGKSGMFDYYAETGHINDGRFTYKNFVFFGKKVELAEKRYIYKKATITTCDESPPHYQIKASRIYLAPGRYFLAYNTLFYIGKMPVFYFPVLYKPMAGGTPFISSFSPGVDGRNGAYVKSNYIFRFSPYTKGKLFLDYFSKKGFGAGAEVDYQKKEKNITNLSVYRIREYGAEDDRWGANGGSWHMLSRFNETDRGTYYSQVFFRALSDPEFNNDFFRSNPFAVSPDKQASLAFTRKSNSTITRLSFDEKYTRTPDLKHFHKSYESAPRLDFQTVPFKLGKTPFMNTFNGYFASVKEADLPYYQKKGRGVWTVSEAMPLARNITFFPSVFYDARVFVATSAVTADLWIGRYGTSLNLRYDRLWGSFDMRYSYTGRLAANKLAKDRRAADKGEEISSLSPELFIMPHYNTYFKANTSYDLRNSARGSFADHLSTMTVEYYHAPRKNLDIYLQDSYSFAKGNRSFVAQVNSGGTQNYTGLGLASYNSQPGVLVFNQTFGFKVPWADSWRAEAILRYKLVHEAGLNFTGFCFFEKSLILYKDFHDFRTRWDFRVRRGVKEFSFLLSLKMNDPARNDRLEESSRNYWHPWRKVGQIRD